MKKLLFLPAAATLLFMTAVNAQTNTGTKTDIASLNKEEIHLKKEKREERKELRKLEGTEVSYQVKQQFYRDFGDLTVGKWERTSNFDKADFSKEGQAMTAYYDSDGTLVGTITPKTFSDLPVNAQKFIDTKYIGYSKEDVFLFDDNESNETDMILYSQQFQDEDNYFVELKKGTKEVIIKVNMSGNVSFFKELK